MSPMDQKRCAIVREDLSSYVDGELSPSRRHHLEEHLAWCPECARDFEEVKALAEGLRRLALPSVPADLAGQILRALVRERGQTRLSLSVAHMWKWWASVSPRVAAAAISLLISLGLVGALLSILRPIPEVPLSYHHASITLDARQYGLLNGTPDHSSGTYTFPRLRSSEHLEQLFRAAASDQLMVVTVVHPDGSASLVDVVTPSGRAVNLREIEPALPEIRFDPALRAGHHPVSTQLVLLVHRLDVNQ